MFHHFLAGGVEETHIRATISPRSQRKLDAHDAPRHAHERRQAGVLALGRTLVQKETTFGVLHSGVASVGRRWVGRSVEGSSEGRGCVVASPGRLAQSRPTRPNRATLTDRAHRKRTYTYTHTHADTYVCTHSSLHIDTPASTHIYTI